MKSQVKSIFMVIIILLFAFGFFANAALAASKQEIIDNAKKEGKLVLYWSLSDEVAEEIVKSFTNKYPFIKVTRFQTSVFKLIDRYYQEILARRPTCDMITSSDLLPYLQFYREGNLLEYDCPEWDNLVDLPKDFVKRGYYAPARANMMGIMVNTKLVDPNTIKSFDDVIKDDRFKGLIGAGDCEHSDNAYPFYYALRKATNSTHYWKRLGELKAAVFTSSEKASEACVAGEWPVLFDIWYYRGYQYGVKKGAPVKGIIPKEGTVVIPCPSAIMKQARNPNAAKLMQDHFFSKETQKMITEKMGYNVAHKEVSPPKGMPSLKDVKVLPLDYDEAEKLRKEWMAEWKKLMNR
jgi:iron(III) transport system substrate-binding protein